MGSGPSKTVTAAAPDNPPGASTSADPVKVNVDNLTWIVSSLKPLLPHLTVESVLCLHRVSKSLVWHVHNLHTWRLLCLRDFPNSRSQFHDRLILRDSPTASTTNTPDADAKELYCELFTQRFIVEAEVCMNNHCTGNSPKQIQIENFEKSYLDR